MSTEQRLYAKLVILNWKDLKTTEANKNKNEAKFNFQGQSARSQIWFDIDFDWNEKSLAHLNLSSMGKYFKGMPQHKIKTHLKYLKSQLVIQNVWKN